jgi:adenosylcobyric acid synthase
VLPGTKSTIADLEWMRQTVLAEAVSWKAAEGTPVLGICGGYQILGRRIVDVEGVEAPAGSAVEGLGLLPVDTQFTSVKATQRVAGVVDAAEGIWATAHGQRVDGYEIHMGETAGEASPFLELDGRSDGAVAPGGRVAGTYLHGIFHNDGFRTALLAALGRPEGVALRARERREDEFDRLASVVREHLDLPRICAMLGLAASGSLSPRGRGRG